MLIEITMTPQEARAVQDAMEAYIDGLTTAYQKDLRGKLSIALSAQESIDDAVDDSATDEDCDSNQCPYCDDAPEVPTVAIGYVLERLYDIDPKKKMTDVQEFISELVNVVKGE